MTCLHQGSDDISEFHGWQKQFAGPDFLVGVAGLDELFSRMQDVIAPGPDQLVSGGVRAFIEQFVAQEIQAAVRSEVEIIVVTPSDAAGNAVQVFRPDNAAAFAFVSPAVRPLSSERPWSGPGGPAMALT